jgi:hypothetical protein
VKKKTMIAAMVAEGIPESAIFERFTPAGPEIGVRLTVVITALIPIDDESDERVGRALAKRALAAKERAEAKP